MHSGRLRAPERWWVVKIRRKGAVKTLSMSDAKDFFEKVLEEGLKPVAKGIADCVDRGLIPVVFYDLGRDGRRAAKMFNGWHPGVRLVGVAPADFLATLGKTDQVTGPWASRPRPEGDYPIFLFVHDGTFLLNSVNGTVSIEPGSTDTELIAGAN